MAKNQKRVIVSFGSKPGGKSLSPHVHAICGDGFALCDKRMGGFPTQVDAVLMEVTCVKCAGHKAYKDLMTNFQVGDSMFNILEVSGQEEPTTDAQGKDKKETKKEKPPEVKKEKVEKKEPEPTKEKKIIHPPKGPGKAKKGKQEKDKLAPIRQDWNILWSEDKSVCDIVHKPSQRVLFENVNSNVALLAVDELNNLSCYWDGGTSLPKTFIPSIRLIVAYSYTKSGINIPLDLTGEVILEQGLEKERRKIKRREKPEPTKRKIKRRDAPKEKEKRKITRRPIHVLTEMTGRKEGTIGFTVLEMLCEGSTLSDMVDAIIKKHKIAKGRAVGKIKAVIRKTARKQGIPIVIRMGENPNEDVYGLHEYIDLKASYIDNMEE